jgi:hypothetical protein
VPVLTRSPGTADQGNCKYCETGDSTILLLQSQKQTEASDVFIVTLGKLVTPTVNDKAKQ